MQAMKEAYLCEHKLETLTPEELEVRYYAVASGWFTQEALNEFHAVYSHVDSCAEIYYGVFG